MKIIDFQHVISKPVQSYDQIKAEAEELKAFVINKKNFKGKHKKMFAVHHAQVCAKPYNFFVVHPKLVVGEEAVYDSRVIINPEITWVTEEPKACVEMLEACASYPFHSPVKTSRYLHIKCKYQDENMVWHEKELTNVAAEIFQHETEHGNGYTIYFPFREPKEQ